MLMGGSVLVQQIKCHKMKAQVVLVYLFCVVFELSFSDRIVIHTSDQTGLKYQFFPLRTKNLEFAVKATNDIHVILTNLPSKTGAYYEIGIGAWSNSRSFIRKDNDQHRVEYMGAEVNQNDFQTFKVTINDTEGSLTVGKRNGSPILHYKDPNYVKMTYFGISTGFGSTGIWNFDFDTFNCNCCKK